MGATVLSVAFGLAHVLGRMVTGLDGVADGATVAITLLVLGGYLLIAQMHRRNPLPEEE